MRPGVSLHLRGLQSRYPTLEARGPGRGFIPGQESWVSRAGSLCGRLSKGRASLLGKAAGQQGEH